MTKEEKIDNPEVKEAEVSTHKNVSSRSSRRHFFTYLIFMLFLAAGSAVAVYYATPLVLASLVSPKPLVVVKSIPRANSESENLPYVEEIPTIENESIATSFFEETEVQPAPQPIVEEIVLIPEPVYEQEKAQPSTELGQLTSSSSSKPQPSSYPNSTNYSILKAMELRDALKNGGECRPLLEELVAIPNKTPEMDQALMSLLQSCLERPLAGQMKEAFHAAKKRAILRIFQANYPTYIAYLKAIPYFLANVRKKNPTGDNPLDILDLIQNAVDADRPQLVLKLIPELPANVQATLNDVTQLAQAESDLNRTLNQLMKALFDRGE